MPQEAQQSYAQWLYEAVRGQPEQHALLVELERAAGEDLVGVRARKFLAKSVPSLTELAELLDILALWPGQRELRTNPRSLVRALNHKVEKI